jgi:uncharacterized protein
MTKHPIIHVEFSAKDREAAGKFYHELFDWEIKQIPDMDYATFSTGDGGTGGGFNPITADNPPGTIMVYVETDSVEDTLRKAEALGGKTVSPRMEIPGVGWFAIFQDPTGNQVAVLEPIPQ